MRIFYKFCIKKTLFLILFALISSQLYAQTQCNFVWSPQLSGTTAFLNSAEAVDSLICWVAGNNGVIRRTTNGSVWIDGNPNPGIINGNIENIEAVDGNTAWCTTSPSINTFIYKTTNGGNNWVQVYSSTGGFINGIHMLSSQNGFAFGDPIANVWNILATTNGGLNWMVHPAAPSAQVAESGFDNCVQVALPNMWFGASLGSVYRTTDNGLNWSSAPTPGINIYVQALHFNSSSLGLASGTSMVKSTNGGANYFAHSVPGAGNISAIEGRGNEFWYIRGEYIYRSTNAGDNWTLVHTASVTLQDMDFPDNISGCLTGWAVGNAGTIIKMTGLLVGKETGTGSIPVSYKLEQNYPNPFNPVTIISYKLQITSYVSLEVYNIKGNKIKNLVNKKQEAGNYEIEFDGTNLASGVYFYKLQAEGFTATKKMLMIK